MKIKKTLAIIMAATLSVAAMTGCSEATTNYAKELANTSSWEATTSEATGTVSVDAKGEKNDVTFTATGYCSGENGYSEVKFNNTQGKMKIPDIKCYIEDGIAYINKSYYEANYTMNGQAVPEGLANIKEDYIGIDLGYDNDLMKTLTSKPDSIIELSKMIFGDNNDLDLPYSQNGREYTLNLDTDATVDLGVKAIKAASNNIEKINSTFNLKLTDEDMNNMKTAVNGDEFNSGIGDIKAQFAGSNIYSKKVFSDNDYTADTNINIKVKDLMNMSISLNQKASKSEVKSIDFPTSKIKVTQAEFNKLVSKGNEKTNVQATAQEATSGLATAYNGK
ncbi:hypothetical protein [Clostridium saccharobutylicum]|uniref:Lipoprotein n=1 Tax=Clostridium saccharobutylicum TaxID=169679 RepID=A0A1S8MQ97_CLOSA|nr:hypothetical protein [Clostridium saccharobutylicum]OOM06369.1 hypothetical protein CLOSAC_42880 [Clostridium saccharobutylicum]